MLAPPRYPPVAVLVVVLTLSTLVMVYGLYGLYLNYRERRRRQLQRLADVEALTRYTDFFGSLDMSKLPEDYFDMLMEESRIILERHAAEEPIYDIIEIRLRGTRY